MTSNDSAKDTISPIKGDHNHIRSSVRTPPPGFSRPDAALLYGSSLDRSAAASAPPSSLFSNDFDIDRAGSYHFRDDLQRSNNGSFSINGETSRFLEGLQQRTMSYNNLAEVLGEGLAESMGDSLEDQAGGLLR